MKMDTDRFTVRERGIHMKSYGKKLMTLAALISALCFICTGCGKMTAEKLTDKVNEALEGRTFIGMDMDLSMDASGMNTIAYSMVPAVDLELYTDSISSMYTGMLEALGVTVQSGQDSQNVSTPFGSVDGYWISGGGVTVYYGFAPLKNAYLTVIRTEFGGTEPDSAAVLGEAFGYAAELTPADIL